MRSSCPAAPPPSHSPEHSKSHCNTSSTSKEPDSLPVDFEDPFACTLALAGAIDQAVGSKSTDKAASVKVNAGRRNRPSRWSEISCQASLEVLSSTRPSRQQRDVRWQRVDAGSQGGPHHHSAPRDVLARLPSEERQGPVLVVTPQPNLQYAVVVRSGAHSDGFSGPSSESSWASS